MLAYRIFNGLIVALLISGCVGTQPPYNTNNYQNTDLIQQSKQFEGDLFASTTEALLYGGLGGGAIGAAIGTASNGSEGAKKGAIFGSVIGSVGAAATNLYMQNSRKENATQVQNKQDVRAVLQNENQALRNYINKAKKTIDQNKKKYADIQALYNSKQISLANAQTELDKLQAEKIDLQNTLSNLRKRRDQASLLVQKDASLRQEVKKYEQLIDKYEREVVSLPSNYIISTAR